MAKKIIPAPSKFECTNNLCGARRASAGNPIYGLGLIGTLFYSLQHATVPRDFLFAFLKALAWPAILVYQAFSRLGL